MHQSLPAATALLLSLAVYPASAHDAAHATAATEAASPSTVQATGGDIAVSDGWVRATLPGQKTGAGYLTLANKGTAADRLLSVSAAAVPRVEIHSMSMEGDVMLMRPVEGGLDVPAGGMVQLAPSGGLHLMLLDLSAPLKEGDTVAVELRFEHAGTISLALPVRRAGGSAM